MTSNYTDITSAGLALGLTSSGVQTKCSSLAAPASGVISLQGASAGSLCRLSHVADPVSDQDAATLSSANAAILKQIRGLQLKKSVNLCAAAPVTLAGGPAVAADTGVRRWSGPFVGSNQSLNFLAIPNATGATMSPSISKCSFSFGFRARLNQAASGNNFGSTVPSRREAGLRPVLEPREQN